MTDDPEYAAMVELIERLQADSRELRELAEDGDVPAVERNAERVAAAARMARKNLPPELLEE
jgi:hypothetical protein